jgi:tripartite-type tricarboxylate transporter receptor subunit TctC
VDVKVTSPAQRAARPSRSELVLSGLASTVLSGAAARAADLLTFVVPFEAGSSPELYARIVAPEMGKLLGRTTIVENKPGAGGNIAAEYVARRPADGSTIVVGTAALCEINPLVFDSLHWSMKDFTPLVKGVQAPLVLVTHPSVPAKTLDQLVIWAKAKPGKLNYASYSPGTPGDFLGAQLDQIFGLDLVAIPYRGSASQVSALMAGDSPLGFAQTQNSFGPIKSGALNAIAVTSPDRFRLLPDTPTFRELDHPEFTTDVWFAGRDAGQHHPDHDCRRHQGPGAAERARAAAGTGLRSVQRKRRRFRDIDRRGRRALGRARQIDRVQSGALVSTAAARDARSRRAAAGRGCAHTRLPALQLQKSRPSSRRKRASTMLCTSDAPSTRRAARAAR